MILRNFYDDRLAQASYLVGCAATGEAVVIDPLREIDQYIEMADRQGLKITAVTETHIHADYLSGTRELAAKMGAHMFLSDEGDENWKYAFAGDPNVTLVKNGDKIKIGNLSLEVMHTPGHTPEHICFLLTDHATSELPHSLFTGDFIFVGDVGRPDLLERAANVAGTMEPGARKLFQSLRKTDALPGSLLLWPAHGAGSACGKSLGGSPVTTLEYERHSNWALRITDEQKFVDEVLSGQPEPPYYFKEMKFLNKTGPTVLGDIQPLPRVQTTERKLVDVRSFEAIRAGYFVGTVALPQSNGLTNWAGWLLAYDEPVTLIADTQEEAERARSAMRVIGLDVVVNWISPVDVKLPISKVADLTCSKLEPDDFVLDVRGINEWRDARILDSHHIPLGYLPERLSEIPRDKRVVVLCGAGGRSPIAISILLDNGFTHVAEIPGGVSEVTERCPALVGSA